MLPFLSVQLQPSLRLKVRFVRHDHVPEVQTINGADARLEHKLVQVAQQPHGIHLLMRFGIVSTCGLVRCTSHKRRLPRNFIVLSTSP